MARTIDPYVDEQPSTEQRVIEFPVFASEDEYWDYMAKQEGDDGELSDMALVNGAAWAGALFGQ